ncbi:hypothetical protein GGF32_008756 [Allomyces javanicus]|nr:hypothetical protein GGF32_008756 [Allomyces javanicus]
MLHQLMRQARAVRTAARRQAAASTCRKSLDQFRTTHRAARLPQPTIQVVKVAAADAYVPGTETREIGMGTISASLQMNGHKGGWRRVAEMRDAYLDKLFPVPQR